MSDDTTIQEFRAWVWELPDGGYRAVDTSVRSARGRKLQSVGLYSTRKRATGHNVFGRPVRVTVTIRRAE